MGPYNYLAFSELRTVDLNSKKYGFRKEVAKEIEEIDKKIATVTSFCVFMLESMSKPISPL